jgi:hypothetical protein
MAIVRHKIGPHEVDVEGDVMHVHMRGPYLPDEARQFLRLSDQIFREHGTMYSLANMAGAPTPSPETRRVLATWEFLGDYVSVMYGVGTVQRAILSLILSAQRLLGSGPQRPPDGPVLLYRG